MDTHVPDTTEDPSNETQRPSISFDPAKYAHHVAELDLTEAQRDELIQIVANIMIAFVDLGFGITPAQNTCGEYDILGGLLPETPDDLLYLDNPDTANTAERLPFEASAKSEES